MILGSVNTIYTPLALVRLTLSFGRSLRIPGGLRARLRFVGSPVLLSRRRLPRRRAWNTYIVWNVANHWSVL